MGKKGGKRAGGGDRSEAPAKALQDTLHEKLAMAMSAVGGGVDLDGGSSDDEEEEVEVPQKRPRGGAGKAKKKAAKGRSELHLDGQDFEDLWADGECDSGYWQRLCPKLTLSLAGAGGKKGSGKEAKKGVAAGDAKGLRKRILEDGYYQVTREELRLSVDPAVLADAVMTLEREGWPATFIMMYDEAWTLADEVGALVSATTGGCANNLDMLAWKIDPNEGQSGFSPHRDRQPDDVAASFQADGCPKYATAWVALTDAVPDNSCLYVIPKWGDPGYSGDDGEDPMGAALPSKEAFQNIRALPAPAGSACVFTHRIIHWGSRGRAGYATPRVALSVACARDDFEPPYIDRALLPYPPLGARFALSCGQVVCYHERLEPSARALALFRRVCQAAGGRLTPAYHAKVRKEFVSAAKDSQGRGGGGGKKAPRAKGRR